MPRRRELTALRCLQTLFSAGSVVGLTDRQLLEQFAAKRGEFAELAFTAIVERHGHLVMRTCRSILRDEHDAQDAFQATFLVLARMAGSLWVGDSLAPWLYRVARRSAIRAKRAVERRRTVEQKAAGMNARSAVDPPSEDFGVVFEEIDRLPERYRAPIVLCDVEDHSYEDAASRLGWPVGTVKSRLARGRLRLKGRLTRRGLGVPAGVLITHALTKSTRAEPPASWVDTTIRAATASVSSTGVNSVPATVATLTEEVLKTMLLTKFKLGVLTTIVALGMTGLATVVAAQKPGNAPPSSTAPLAPAAEPSTAPVAPAAFAPSAPAASAPADPVAPAASALPAPQPLAEPTLDSLAPVALAPPSPPALDSPSTLDPIPAPPSPPGPPIASDLVAKTPVATDRLKLLELRVDRLAELMEQVLTVTLERRAISKPTVLDAKPAAPAAAAAPELAPPTPIPTPPVTAPTASAVEPQPRRSVVRKEPVSRMVLATDVNKIDELVILSDWMTDLSDPAHPKIYQEFLHFSMKTGRAFRADGRPVAKEALFKQLAEDRNHGLAVLLATSEHVLTAQYLDALRDDTIVLVGETKLQRIRTPENDDEDAQSTQAARLRLNRGNRLARP